MKLVLFVLKNKEKESRKRKERGGRETFFGCCASD
jgi:hypothetical protein